MLLPPLKSLSLSLRDLPAVVTEQAQQAPKPRP
jgi:hypothetical protein